MSVSSNPAFSPHAVTVRAALGLLEEMVSLPEHEFWPDDLTLKEAIPKDFPIVSHEQVTDAYLLALAGPRGQGSDARSRNAGVGPEAPGGNRGGQITGIRKGGRK